MNCHYHPDVPATAFCQFCGKPLCKDCVRNVSGAVYCEACLAERLRAAGAPTTGFSTGTPHPALAGLLGLVPGVGAMYNGQYAKAIAHVLIFAVLASLGDHSSIFGILAFTWVIYQAFDGYQTALARRDGLPLPNPFGLNDIAQRLGIHPLGAPGTVPPGAASGVPPAPPPVPPPPGVPNWEPPIAGAAGFVPPAGEPYAGQSYAGQSGNPSGYAAVPGQPYTPYPVRRDVPTGAIVLIGLGMLFLLGSLGWLHEDWIGRGWPLLIIGLGVWIIYRRSRSIPPVVPPPQPGAPVAPDTQYGSGYGSGPAGGSR